MKKYKSSLLIFIIISLSLCGCSNQEVSNLCDVYEGETVDLSEIYSKHKDEATRLFNFYYNYGKHVESKDYKNYNYSNKAEYLFVVAETNSWKSFCLFT